MNLDAVRAALLFGGSGKNGGAALQFSAADAGKHLIVGSDGAVTAAFAGSSADTELADPAALQALGAGGEAASRLAVGSLVKSSWTDTVTGRLYDAPLRIVGFGSAVRESGGTAHGMWVQAKYAHPYGVPFGACQGILHCADGLAAGTYSFTFGETVGMLGFVSKGNSFHFALTQDVPAGGVVAGLQGWREAAKPYDTLKITTYAADRRTKLETVGIAAGAAGTDLGTLTAAGDAVRNGLYRFGYGDSGWRDSALRQYLNSDKPKGAWWTPQNLWDLAPAEADTKDGYLRGLDAATAAALCSVQVQTRRADGTTDVTCDKVFLPALEQLYLEPEQTGEGGAQEYYKNLNGSGTPYTRDAACPELRALAVENRKLPQTVRLRSAYAADPSRTWCLGTKGQANDGVVTGVWRFTPMMFLGG